MWKRSELARAPKQTMSGDQNQFQSFCRIWRRFPKEQERNGELFNVQKYQSQLEHFRLSNPQVEIKTSYRTGTFFIINTILRIWRRFPKEQKRSLRKSQIVSKYLIQVYCSGSNYIYIVLSCVVKNLKNIHLWRLAIPMW